MGAGRVGCVFVSAVCTVLFFKMNFHQCRLGPIALASQSILFTTSAIIQGALSLTGATTIRSVQIFLSSFDVASVFSCGF